MVCIEPLETNEELLIETYPNKKWVFEFPRDKMIKYSTLWMIKVSRVNDKRRQVTMT